MMESQVLSQQEKVSRTQSYTGILLPAFARKGEPSHHSCPAAISSNLPPNKKFLILAPVDLNPSLQRCKALLHAATWGPTGLSEDQLSTKSPGLRHIPGFSNVLADAGLKML